MLPTDLGKDSKQVPAKGPLRRFCGCSTGSLDMSIKLQWVCVFVEKVPFSVRFQSETTGKPTKGDAMRAAFLQGSKT